METCQPDTAQAYYCDPEVVWLDVGYRPPGYYIKPYDERERRRLSGPFVSIESARNWSREHLA